jgi:signal transduction histidine kinase
LIAIPESSDFDDHQDLIENEVRVQQAVSLLNQQPGLIMGNIGVTLISAANFVGEVDLWIIATWLGVIWLLMVPVTLRYFRLRNRKRPKQISKGHIRNIMAWSVVLGVVIAAGIIYLYPRNGIVGEVTVYVMAFALWGGSLGAVWMVPVACVGYSAPIVLGTVVATYIHDGAGGAPISIILVLTIVIMALFLRINFRSFRENVKVAIERDTQSEEIRRRRIAELKLAESLEDLRRMQNQLIVQEKMASLGALTAGIAHEIKNPLNFINNYADLSVELMDEMSHIVRNRLEAFPEEEVGELAELSPTLRKNLGKIVDHGRRADRIVKSMLLHSRGETDDLSRVVVNEIVEEALNLAYHGVRAQNQNFNVALDASLDESVGELTMLAQDMNRALLNIFNNAFYAVHLKAGKEPEGYSPEVSVTTSRSVNPDAIVIRIRDNGPGIPDDVKDKLFQPFFTTKPAGEGTGLGLSLVYDIIVQQHHGELDVTSVPGAFTEFVITLPTVIMNDHKSTERT